MAALLFYNEKAFQMNDIIIMGLLAVVAIIVFAFLAAFIMEMKEPFDDKPYL